MPRLEPALSMAFVLLVLGLAACSDRDTSSSEIATAGELQAAYGLDADDQPTIELDPAEVPPNLRDLIPYAETWGIGDDVIRSRVAQATSEADKIAFRAALESRADDVNAWLDSFQADEPMSDSAAAFMFMLLALEEDTLASEDWAMGD